MMTSSTTAGGIAATTAAIVASSLRVGITAATRRRGDIASEAPAQPAAGAGGGRPVAQQRRAKFAVARAVPDRAQRLLRRVAERERVIAALRERRDAARQDAAVRGDVHQRPRPP